MPTISTCPAPPQTPPASVQWGRLPGWLRSAWLRTMRGKRRRHSLTDGWTIAQHEISEWLDGQRRGYWAQFDGWGTVVICGKRCFVYEPDANLVDAILYLAPLADLIDARMGILPGADGGVRVLLYPPADRRTCR